MHLRHERKYRHKQTQTQSWRFEYDPLNQLTRATSEPQRVDFTYDALGRRLSKVVQTANIETDRQTYLYDGENEIAAFSGEGLLKQLRVLGLAKHKNLPATVAIELDGELFAPFLDCQGNIRRLKSALGGAIFESYEFDAFGNQVSDATVHRNPWRYASKRLDSETQLIYFGKRYYDPLLARWLTTDPAGFVDTTNLYAYLRNNPFKYVDPDGRCAIFFPLITWGCAGLGFALPSITTLITTTLVTAVVYCSADVALTHLGKYIARLESAAACRKEKFVGTPGELEKDPEWIEETHPKEREKGGRRKFRNKETGRVVEYDKGEPGAPGHGGRDHYHHPNPNYGGKGKKDKYLDTDGNPVNDGSGPSHLYPPEGVSWDY